MNPTDTDDFKQAMHEAYLQALKTKPCATKSMGEHFHMFQAGILFALDGAKELIQKLLEEPK